MLDQIKQEVATRVLAPVVRNLGDVFSLNASVDNDKYELGIFGRFLGKICKRIFATFPSLARAVEHALLTDPDAQKRLNELRVPDASTSSFIFDIIALGIRSAKEEKKKKEEIEAEQIVEAKKKEEEIRKQIEQQLCQFELPSSISLDRVREIISSGKFNQFTLLLQKLKNGGEISDDDMMQCGLSPIDFNRSFEPAVLKAKLPRRNFNKQHSAADVA